MNRTHTAVDLFAGAGGLTTGLLAAGYAVIGAVELDPVACITYKMNNPKVKLWECDVKKVSGPALLRDSRISPGNLDLLAACPPCQSYSTMRTRNGRRRPRDADKGLILDVLRLVRSMQPRSVMIENVPALARTHNFRKFCAGLRACGYRLRYDVLNVADYGVAQNRRRLILLASKSGTPEFAARSRKRKTVRAAIGRLPAPVRSADPLHHHGSKHSDRINRVISMIPANGGSRSALPIESQLPCHQRSDGYKDVYGRMAWDKPAPTITGGCINPSKGRFLHPTQDRAISLREAALLQSFPRDYRFPLEHGRYKVALMIGNALPPEFIRRHALALRSLPIGIGSRTETIARRGRDRGA